MNYVLVNAWTDIWDAVEFCILYISDTNVLYTLETLRLIDLIKYGSLIYPNVINIDSDQLVWLCLFKINFELHFSHFAFIVFNYFHF